MNARLLKSSKSCQNATKVFKRPIYTHFDRKASPHAVFEATKAMFPEKNARKAAKIRLGYLVLERQIWFR